MILSVVIAAAALASQLEDFCPMVPGTRWTYEDANGLQVVDEIGKPVDIGKGQTAIPKTTSISGRSPGAELYRVDNDTLLLVGYIDKNARPPAPGLNLLPEPQPIVRLSNAKADWQYLGEVPTGLGPVLLQVRGYSNKGPKKKVLDREVETMAVQVISRIGNDAQRVEIRQDVIYGKGIGMVEMTEATKAQGQTVKKMLKLVKFEPPQG